jgi:hypothetical protein
MYSTSRDQTMYDDPMRRDPVVDPGMPMCHVDQQGPSDDWQQAYTLASRPCDTTDAHAPLVGNT